MKKYLSIPLMICGITVNAQTPNGGIYNNGARIVVSSGTYLYISGTTSSGNNTGDYYSKEAGASDGLLKVITGGTVVLEGDFISDANTSPIDDPATNNGTVEFRGTGATSQIGSTHGTATPFTFGKLVLNKTSGAYTLLDDVIVKDEVNFAGPGIVSTGANTFVMESTTTGKLSGTFTGNDRFIHGNLRRYITGTSAEYFMPVGSAASSARYHPIGIAPSALTGVTYLNATVGHTAKTGNNKDSTFIVNNMKYNSTDPIIGTAENAADNDMLEWSIIPDAVASGGTYSVNLYVANTDLSAADDNKFIVMKRHDASTTVTEFNFPASIPATDSPGRIYNGGNGYATGTGYTSFSKFVLAKSSHVLPIELLTFKGKCDNGDIILNWVTASEQDNNYFSIEKSSNGDLFIPVGTVETQDGDANHIQEYEYVNLNESTSAYFQLRQTDNSGHSTVSDMIYVKGCAAEEGLVEVNAYALNGKDVLVTIEAPDTREYNISLMDLSGRMILEPQKQLAVRGNNTYELNPSLLSSGFYMVHIFNDSESYTHKLFLR